MDFEELATLVAKGESEILEFKKSTSLFQGTAETLCGFLNGKGGTVLIGVTSDKKTNGQHVSDRTLQEIANFLAKFEPPAVINVDRIAVQNNKEVIVMIALPRKTDTPYTWEGRAYQRIGSTTSRMPQQTYQRLLLDRDHNNHRWETSIAIGYNLADLDSDEILRTLRLGAETRRLPESQGDSLGSILERLGLCQDGRLLNAAVVLFGKRFLPDFPQCQLRLARFKGLDKSEFLDQNQLTGNAFYLLEEAMIFLRRHLPIAGKILPDVLERKDEPLFPLEALREALVNAFCHRIYSHPGGAISIAIFDDRLEMWNDGLLGFGLTPADLKIDHMSHQRNPLIASVFYKRGLIEKWGRGTQKIVKLCVEAGHPEPEFFEQANSFVVRFLPNGYIAPHRITHDLTDQQRMILQSLSEASRKGLSLADIKNKFPNPPTDRRLRDDVQHLKRLGLIHLSGHGRGAMWKLKMALNNKI